MLNVISVDINSLIPDPSNARKHDQKNLDSIKGSLAKFGQVEPLVVNKATKIVIGGNGRLAAMKSLGLKTAQVVEIDINNVDAAALSLALNRTGELASWDDGVLSKTLESLKLDGFDLSTIGFDDDDLMQWIKTPEVVPGCDEDEVPEVTETRCKVGDLWQLGNHRVLCGDSTNVQHVERLMGGEKADMVFTDPPYGISYDDKNWVNENRRQSKTAKQNNFGMIEKDDSPFDPSLILDIFKNVKEIFIWGAANFCQKIPHSGAWIVWDKKLEQQDECLWGSFDLAWSKQNHKWLMCRIPWGGFQSKEKGDVRHHPTQKPIGLAEWFFERWGKDCKNVVDLFLGSGSTLIACEKTGRRCYGLEIDPHYVSGILARWEKFTGLTAKLLE